MKDFNRLHVGFLLFFYSFAQFKHENGYNLKSLGYPDFARHFCPDESDYLSGVLSEKTDCISEGNGMQF